MKTIQLTQGYSTLVDDEDFEELNKFKWHVKHHRNTIYAVRTEWILGGNGKQKHFKMHRVILGITNPKELIDHKNHNGLDNQKNNLRICNGSENQKNRLSRKNSTSKYLGVSLSDNVWIATIKYGDKTRYLGRFEKTNEGEVMAAKKYNEFAKIYHGEFANLNNV